ncbi:XynB [Pluralibacter gergoviae]|uniref:alpha/beta hydrolase n=1 Tax=Pluralibacter gergoviae TaxID=61647 RepID=UPI0006523F08|nr:alpha/beta hydrolase [Pluralibacter gergoviae]KMK20283.1 XynB [Pluralibacter gergoviae]
MDRRQFLTTFAAALCLKTALLEASAEEIATSTIPLWDGAPPGGGGPKGERSISARGAVSHVAIPTLTALQPVKPNGRAVLIAAGGGYKRMEMVKEAWPAAHWLAQRGYTPYVLCYRLPGEGWRDGNLVPLQDAQRALRLIRRRHAKVSVLGFSAGGHLLGMAALRPDFASYPARDALDRTPASADEAALIYPVVTLEAPYDHTSTHRLLVGNHPAPGEEARWSLQTYVTPQSPPLFLVQAEDDAISNPRNTLILAAACQREKVAVEMHRCAAGGHGFGMGRPGTPTAAWPTAYEAWLCRRR